MFRGDSQGKCEKETYFRKRKCMYPDLCELVNYVIDMLRMYSLGNFFLWKSLLSGMPSMSQNFIVFLQDFQLTGCCTRSMIRRNMVKTLLVYGSKFGGLRIVSKYLACLQIFICCHCKSF